MNRDRKQEIETIRARTITLNLSDADYDRLLKKAGSNGLTVAELLQNFIADLVDGTYANGSDERMYAQDWFDRCYFGMFEETTLLRSLLQEDHDPSAFLLAWEENQLYKENPKKYCENLGEVYDPEDPFWFEEALEKYLKCWKTDREPNMSIELEAIRAYLAESENLNKH